MEKKSHCGASKGDFGQKLFAQRGERAGGGGAEIRGGKKNDPPPGGKGDAPANPPRKNPFERGGFIQSGAERAKRGGDEGYGGV